MDMIRDTSLNAYEEIILEKLICEQQIKVIEYLSKNPDSTDKEISVNTRININAITGRRNELTEMGIVLEDGKRKCSITGRLAYQWKLNPNPDKELIKKFKGDTMEEDREIKVEEKTCKGTKLFCNVTFINKGFKKGFKSEGLSKKEAMDLYHGLDDILFK